MTQSSAASTPTTWSDSDRPADVARRRGGPRERAAARCAHRVVIRSISRQRGTGAPLEVDQRGSCPGTTGAVERVMKGTRRHRDQHHEGPRPRRSSPCACCAPAGAGSYARRSQRPTGDSRRDDRRSGQEEEAEGRRDDQGHEHRRQPGPWRRAGDRRQERRRDAAEEQHGTSREDRDQRRREVAGPRIRRRRRAIDANTVGGSLPLIRSARRRRTMFSVPLTMASSMTAASAITRPGQTRSS